MSTLIAHASIDERGKASGGIAGDQSKKEVCIREWYSKPWSYVIRFTDVNMAEKVAQAMEAAAKNDNIGYNQNKRNTLLAEARKHNYDVSKVNTPCDTDCSALVSVACMFAGVPESALTLQGNCAHTRNIKQMLKSTGEVEIYTTSLYTAKTEKLKRGDILLKEGSHVAVVVKNDILLKEGAKGESVKWLQTELNKYGYGLAVDGDFGKKTKAAVMDFQKNHGLVVDGIAGKNTISKLKSM